MSRKRSQLKVQLSKSLSEDWEIVKAVFEEEVKASCARNAAKFEGEKQSIQDEFAAHLLAVHCKWCETCPTPSRGRRERREKHSATADNQDNRGKIYVSISTQTSSSGCCDNDHPGYGASDDFMNSGSSSDLSPSSSKSRSDQNVNDVGYLGAIQPSSTIDATAKVIKVEVLEDNQDAYQWHEGIPMKEELEPHGYFNVVMDTSNHEPASQQCQQEDIQMKEEQDYPDCADISIEACGSEFLCQHEKGVPTNAFDGNATVEKNNEGPSTPGYQEGTSRTNDKDHEDHTSIQFPTDGKAGFENNNDPPSSSGHQEGTSHYSIGNEKDQDGDTSFQFPADARIAFEMNSGFSGSSVQEEGSIHTNENDKDREEETTIQYPPGINTPIEVQNPPRCEGDFQTPQYSLHTNTNPVQGVDLRRELAEYAQFGSHTSKFLESPEVSYVDTYFSNHVRSCEDETFTCLLCNKNFLRKGDIKRHMMIHTGQKIFQCSVCDKSFAQKRYLKRHMRSIHSGHFPYYYSFTF